MRNGRAGASGGREVAGTSPSPHSQPGLHRPDENLRARQVNVKLTDEDYEKLQRAARIYGVRPATMAQLLVNRGLRAVLEGDPEERD